VFDNWALSKIFELKMEEVTGDWRELRNEELHDFYTTPRISLVIRSMRMRWAENLARIG
jgi:hypothetical protein